MKTKLRESAKDASNCMSCGASNHDGQQLCLAHSNELRHGRGAYHKTPDIFGAIVCAVCHDEIDGRRAKLTLDEKRLKHRIAHDRTLMFWWTEGYLSVGAKPRMRMVGG